MAKQNGIKKMGKAIGNVVATAFIATPLIYPALTFFNNAKAGTPLAQSMDMAMRYTVGLTPSTGEINWPQMTKFVIGSGAAVAIGLAARKYLIKRL